MKLALLTISLACGLSFAQSPATSKPSVFLVEGSNLYTTNLNDFLSKVTESNATLSSKKLAVENALALKDMMSIPNINPSLTFSRGSYNLNLPRDTYQSSGVTYPWGGTMTSPQSNTVTLSGTIEGYGKRNSRINYAETEISKANIDSNLTLKDVEGIAVFAYIDALRLKQIWQAIQNSSNLISAFKDSESDAALATNTGIQKNILADFKYLALGLNSLIGSNGIDLPNPTGTLNVPTRTFNSVEFNNDQFERRSDIIAARAALKTADANIDLTSKSRRIDISASLWLSQTPAYYSSTYGSMDTTQATGFSLTFPIPISNLSNGALTQAHNNKTQIELLIKDAFVRASAEANQMLITYNSSKLRLLDAEALYTAAIKDSTRNTKNFVRQRELEVDLIDAQTFHLKSLIQLMRSIGDYSLPTLN